STNGPWTTGPSALAHIRKRVPTEQLAAQTQTRVPQPTSHKKRPASLGTAQTQGPQVPLPL
ncbi:hypothetical protein IWW49_006038, partial [Coemansia sp. RSA 1797]